MELMEKSLIEELNLTLDKTLIDRIEETSQSLLEKIYECDAIKNVVFTGEINDNSKSFGQKRLKDIYDLRPVLMDIYTKAAALGKHEYEDIYFFKQCLGVFDETVPEIVEEMSKEFGSQIIQDLDKPMSETMAEYKKHLLSSANSGSLTKLLAAVMPTAIVPMEVAYHLHRRQGFKQLNPFFQLLMSQKINLRTIYDEMRQIINGYKVNTSEEQELIKLYNKSITFELNLLQNQMK